MHIRDSRRPGEQIMPDHDDGKHAVYVPWPPGQHRTVHGSPVSPASANTQRDWETDLFMRPPCRIFAVMMLTARVGALVRIILLGAEVTEPPWPS